MTEYTEDRITVLAKEFTPAAMEFHRRSMSDKGYALDGQIVSQKFMMLDGPGEPSELFDGEVYYAARFVRRDVG